MMKWVLPLLELRIYSIRQRGLVGSEQGSESFRSNTPMTPSNHRQAPILSFKQVFSPSSDDRPTPTLEVALFQTTSPVKPTPPHLSTENPYIWELEVAVKATILLLVHQIAIASHLRSLSLVTLRYCRLVPVRQQDLKSMMVTGSSTAGNTICVLPLPLFQLSIGNLSTHTPEKRAMPSRPTTCSFLLLSSPRWLVASPSLSTLSSTPTRNRRNFPCATLRVPKSRRRSPPPQANGAVWAWVSILCLVLGLMAKSGSPMMHSTLGLGHISSAGLLYFQRSSLLGTKTHILVSFMHYSRDHTSNFRCSRPFSSDVAYGSGASQLLPVNRPWCSLCPRVRGSRRWRQSSSVQVRPPLTVLHACSQPHLFGRINVGNLDYPMLFRANAFGLQVKFFHRFFTLLSKSRPLMLLSFNFLYCFPSLALPLSLPPVVSISAV